MASEGSIRIPPDIITKILYLLPVKSVGRFSCVSKDWLTLISEPRFIKTYHNINTHKQSHLIIFDYTDQLYSLQFPLHEAEPSLEATKKIPFVSDHLTLDIHGSCNGLVLMSSHNFTNAHVTVLNPTTGKFVRFRHPIVRKANDLLDIPIMYGFGYDSLTDDYKVVTISVFRKHCQLIHVYSLRTNTWRKGKDSPYNHFTRWSLHLSGVFVNGVLHWGANKGSDGYLPVIVAFSLAKEKFSELPWPESHDILSGRDFKLVDLGGKLAILLNDEIWVMNEYGVRESWTRVLVDVPREIRRVEPVSFSDNDKLLLPSNGCFLIHDIGERTSCKVLLPSDYFKVRGTYVESLVSPKFF